MRKPLNDVRVLRGAQGYWAFGNKVASNVLFSLSHPQGVITLASLMVLVHVMGSYVRLGP